MTTTYTARNQISCPTSLAAWWTGPSGSPMRSRRCGSGTHTAARGSTGQASRRSRSPSHTVVVADVSPCRRRRAVRLIAAAAPPAKKTNGMTCPIQVAQPPGTAA